MTNRSPKTVLGQLGTTIKDQLKIAFFKAKEVLQQYLQNAHLLTQFAKRNKAAVKLFIIAGTAYIGYLYGPRLAPWVDGRTQNTLLAWVSLDWWKGVLRLSAAVVFGILFTVVVDPQGTLLKHSTVQRAIEAGKQVFGAYQRVFQYFKRLVHDFCAFVHKPVSIAVGAYLGYLHGDTLAPLLDASTQPLLLEFVTRQWWEVMLRWISLLVAGVSCAIAVDQHGKLYDLRRRHYLIFGKYYQFARPSGNALTDLIWAYTAGFVIMGGSFIAASFVWPFLPFILSKKWTVVAPLLILFSAGWSLVAMPLKELFTEMFKPRRLERDLQNAGIYKAELERRRIEEEEQQKHITNKNDEEIRKNDW